MLRLCPHLLRRGLIAGAALAAAALGYAPSVAQATYVVTACGPSGVNLSWFESRTAPETHLPVHEVCPTVKPDPYGDLRQGVGILDRLWGGAMPPGGDLDGSGKGAEWRFTAPPGTRIRRADVQRDIGSRDRGWHPYGRIDDVFVASESCVPGMDEAYCRIESERNFTGLNATTLAYGVRCPTDPGCRAGGSLHEVWALILRADVTLDDTQPPTVTALEPTRLGDGTWQRGTVAATFTATDNTGVQQRRLTGLPDGAHIAHTARSIADGGCFTRETPATFVHLQPCAGDRGVNGRLATATDVCAWPAGTHTIRPAAVDAGGAITYGPAATVRVDCIAPRAAFALVPEALTAGARFEPAVVSTDAHSGVARIERQVSTDGGTTWLPQTEPVTVASGGVYRFRARATDHAGNASTWVESGPLTGLPDDTTAPGGPRAPTPTGPAAPAETPQPPPTPTAAPPATEAVPRNRLPAPAPTTPAGPAPAAPARPQPTTTTRTKPVLRITRVRHRTGLLTLTGTAPATTPTVTIRVAVPDDRTLIRRVPTRRGRFTLRLRTLTRPRAVEVRTPPTRRHLAGSTRLVLR